MTTTSDHQIKQMNQINQQLNEQLGKLGGNRLDKFLEWQARPAAVLMSILSA